MGRLPGTVQVDLDDLWVIAASNGSTYDHRGGEAYADALRCFLKIFDGFGVKVTFFTVGRDLLIREKREAVAEAFASGHEIANHSMNHFPDFAGRGEEEKAADMRAAHREIAGLTGVPPVGFKAPNYNYSPALARSMGAGGYLYDSSLLATPFSPLLRLARRVNARGKFTYLAPARCGFLPQRPFAPCPGSLRVIGVSSHPHLRVPIHASYVFFLERWRMGKRLFRSGLTALRSARLPLNYVFHLCDCAPACPGDVPAFHRGWPSREERVVAIRGLLKEILAAYYIVPTRVMYSRVTEDAR